MTKKVKYPSRRALNTKLPEAALAILKKTTYQRAASYREFENPTTGGNI
jgi:hypothetical protein